MKSSKFSESEVQDLSRLEATVGAPRPTSNATGKEKPLRRGTSERCEFENEGKLGRYFNPGFVP